jgi:vitamin K-dependent gamma-carboxylase
MTIGLSASLTSARCALCARLFAPVDITSLVYFRVVFGAIMLWEVWRYLSYGWVEQFYIVPRFHFTYYGFDWVKPWSGDGMVWHFYALGALAVCIAVGFWYRVSATLFFLGFTYVFLLDKAYYLNHFYLVGLVSFLMIFIPAHRAFSIDSIWGTRSETAPAWALWLLRAQIGIPYFYGGLAKIHGDWLRGDTMGAILAPRTDFPLIGALFSEPWVILLFTYGGLLLDLLVVPFLLWKKARPFAFAAAVFFHLMNTRLFSIGIFPWFMIAATLMFFPPDWPRRLVGPLRRPETRQQRRYASRIKNAETVKTGKDGKIIATGLDWRQKGTMALVATFLGLQLVIPLRHFLYPGDVYWTAQGHRFSWRMILFAKSGEVRFFATDPASNRTWEVPARDYLTRRQQAKLARPDMILQFSHFIANELRRRGYDKIEVRVDASLSLNRGPRQPLIDPTVNLAAQSRWVVGAPWILPFPERPPAARQQEDSTFILEE